MSTLSQADRLLLTQVRAGDGQAWAQLVDRYQGRLVSFARGRVRNADDAEDLVQEAFISFLRSVDRYQERASIETYLFTILRRRIIDHLRGRHLNVCLLADSAGGRASMDDSRDSDPMARIAGGDPSASFYMRQQEARDQLTDALADAMAKLIEGYKAALNFRDLQIAEMLFYAQMRNKDIASIMDIREQHVALIKHRCVKQVRADIEAMGDRGLTCGMDTLEDGMLWRVWEDGRLSCPKRSTIGQHLLGTLDEAWRDYVSFHVDRLGCRFCQANLDDLKQKNEGRDRDVMRERIMQSTVGFLKHG